MSSRIGRGRTPDRPCLISETGTLSYRALAERINRYARWALSVGIEAGDTVCLVMPSKPDYLAAWLGITQVGGVVALINIKLVGPSLSHCINVADAGHVILASELADVFETAVPHLKRKPEIWIHGANKEAGIEGRAGKNRWQPTVIGGAARGHDQRSGAVDLYLGHDRPAEGGQRQSSPHPELGRLVCRPRRCFARGPAVRLPAGPITASAASSRPCSMLTAGASVVLSDKFSAGRFWQDIVRWDCTLFQYIGELCRYLLKANASEFERNHRLRLACGNGLRGDVLGSFSGALCDSANPGILRRDRRQFLALQRGRKTRCDWPDSAAVGPSLSRGDRAARYGHRHSRAQRGRPLYCLRAWAKSARPSAASAPPTTAGAASRAIPTRARPTRKSCATCWRQAMPGFAPAT